MHTLCVESAPFIGTQGQLFDTIIGYSRLYLPCVWHHLRAPSAAESGPSPPSVGASIV